MRPRNVPWFDMIGFYILLPVAAGELALLLWRYGGVWEHGTFFRLVSCIVSIFGILPPLLTSVGVFVVKLAEVVGRAILSRLEIVLGLLGETWDEMVDTMIETVEEK